MKSRIFKWLYIITIFINGASIKCQAQIDINLDLYKLTLNDSPLAELNIEKVTNLLGRPSATKKNEMVADVVGPEIYYHTKGLEFWFSTKKKDPQQRVFAITIYLARTWDKEFSEFYLPFTGKIIPNLNPNQKISDIIPLFKNYSVTIQTAEDRRKELDAALKGVKVNINSATQYDIVRVINKNAHINIFSEELTKFLEYLTITY